LSFEVKYSDLGGRIGKLNTAHGIIDTPAFIPVVHPVKQIIDIKLLKKIGFKAVITNAYITLKYYGDDARKKGIHQIIDFDGIVMTDSGGYQVLEYGSIEVSPIEIAKFEIDIQTDIAVPLDKPTGYGLEYNKAIEYVNQTINNVKETVEVIKNNNHSDNTNDETIWAGPVQGAEHLDLVEKSAKLFDDMNFKLMALGSPVELMEAYEFSKLSEIIYTLKKTIPFKPIHLFGAGHPLTIPLAVALGCDMFDSASYILYAKDNRYMHSYGTARLEEITYFPCSCPICNSFTPSELLETTKINRIIQLSTHNLYVLKKEVNSVKQSILDGRLWEYIMSKAHNHPKLMEAVRLFKNFEYLEDGTRIYKDKAIYFNEPYDQHRPEAKRFRKMVKKYIIHNKNKLIILYPEMKIHPFYTSKNFVKIKERFSDVEVFSYNPYLGVIPAEISDIFPASQNIISIENDSLTFALNYSTFIDTLKFFLKVNHDKNITIIANEFMKQIISYFHSQKNIENIFNSSNIKITDYKETSWMK
jgi:7-cyano-7-deazaguanine tRNA-ribosyltransferase